MRQCPKCSRRFDDSARICRTCGTFLEAVADVGTEAEERPEVPAGEDLRPPLPAPTIEEPDENSETSSDKDEPSPGGQSWTCPQCEQPVPDTFDICWNCRTSRDGTPDPNFVKPSQDSSRDQAKEAPATQGPVRRHGPQCPKCGSSKIIPRARVLAHGQYSADVQVVIYGNPDALIFTDPHYGRLMADICGECGRVEFRVEDPQELYDDYRDAQTEK